MKPFLFMRCVTNRIGRKLNSRPLQRRVHMSSIYRPFNIVPLDANAKAKKAPSNETKKRDDKEPLSKSLKLLVDNGIIRPSSCFGAYHLLPFAMKSMEKLVNIIDHFMELVNCQKIQMPVLTSASLWKMSGRLEECKPELMKVLDRHSKEFVLSPTHEEAICDLIQCQPLSHRQLPQRLYQITEKFRDEMKPRFGLMRGRQFLMKDLYTFDVDLDQAGVTYDEISKAYQMLLDALDLEWIRARGSTGTIGGVLSHEFHILSEVGEDSLLICKSCNDAFNVDLLEEEVVLKTVREGGSLEATDVAHISKCLNCGGTSLSSSTSIEVGHLFLLSTKYTKPLNAVYLSENGGRQLLEMGCYGLGVSRLLAAAIEVKSTADEIRWPLRIAPYIASIIPPKKGSKEDDRGTPLASKMYSTLSKTLPRDVIYDDRTNQTIGKRLLDNKKLGIPYLIVCGKAVNDPSGPLMELHDVNKGSVVVDNLHNIVNFLFDVKSMIQIKL